MLVCGKVLVARLLSQTVQLAGGDWIPSARDVVQKVLVGERSFGLQELNSMMAIPGYEAFHFFICRLYTRTRSGGQAMRQTPLLHHSLLVLLPSYYRMEGPADIYPNNYSILGSLTGARLPPSTVSRDNHVSRPIF